VFTVALSQLYWQVEDVQQAYIMEVQSNATVRLYLTKSDRKYTSGTTPTQFVTTVTSDTVTLIITIEVTLRACPKPASHCHQESKQFSEKYITQKYVKHRRSVEVYVTFW
jgi:hypothetical protein